MASLTVTIFQYAMGPYEEWHGQAWAASLVLTFGTLIFFIVAKALIHTAKALIHTRRRYG